MMRLGRLAWIVGVAILVLVVNVGISIVYMVVYGHLIDPGHDEQYYREHIKVAAPYGSIVAGMRALPTRSAASACFSTHARR